MQEKHVFNVDPVTRAFIGAQQCYKTSIDPDTWHSTGLVLEVEPPATGQNEIAVANSELTDWEIKPYYVGTTFWLPDGSEHTIAEIGEIPPENALYEKPVVQRPPQNEFTPLEFLEKFTEAEQSIIVGETMVDVAVKIWYDKLLAASFISLDDPRTVGGLNALVAKGLLEASRVEVIMTPEEQPQE